MRKVTRHVHEGAREMARDITKTDAYVASSRARKKVEMLGWLVEEKGIAPHIPVFDKSARRDGTFRAGRLYL